MRFTTPSLFFNRLKHALLSAPLLALAACGGSYSNSAKVVLDAGPAGNGINVPYVTVSVCQPGTSTCKTIDHVMVDTGSYGLRLLASSMSGLTLPAVNAPSGAAAGECAAFVSGYIWGPVQQADVKIAGETASSVPIQVIGANNAAFSAIPVACSNKGLRLASAKDLGANGILGIGMLQQDCGSACVTAASDVYYACPATGCVASRMPLTSQVANPVALFARNNNGVVLSLPSVAARGARSLTGTLTFGIGTQANNAIKSEKVYAADAKGNFVTVYNGQKLASSFLDSGSNGLYFNDSSIPLCKTSSIYCPADTLSLSAVNSSYDGATSGTVNFTLTNVDKLSGSIVAASIGGSNGSFSHGNSTSYFNWGLPFFFGRNVFVAFNGASTPKGSGPYWAY